VDRTQNGIYRTLNDPEHPLWEGAGFSVTPLWYRVPDVDGPVEAQAAREAIRMFYGAMGVLEQRQVATPRIVGPGEVRYSIDGPYGLRFYEERVTGSKRFPDFELVRLNTGWSLAHAKADQSGSPRLSGEANPREG